jgi:hypothetical protein
MLSSSMIESFTFPFNSSRSGRFARTVVSHKNRDPGIQIDLLRKPDCRNIKGERLLFIRIDRKRLYKGHIKN